MTTPALAGHILGVRTWLLLFALPYLLFAVHDSAAQPANGLAVPYAVSVEGLADKSLEDQFKSASQLERLSNQPPATLLGLRRRLRADERRLQEILRSNGYYAARIISSIIRPDPAAPADSKTAVSINVTTGLQYALSGVDAIFEPAAVTPIPNHEAITNPLIGQMAKAGEVVRAERTLVGLLNDSGYPFARALPRRAEVDHGRQQLAATLRFNPGALHDFGETTFNGLESVEAQYLLRLVPWQSDATFKLSSLAGYRQALINTQLFTSVKVEPQPEGSAVVGDPLGVVATVREGRHRTIGAAVKYARDEGIGGEVSWRHRNFFGQGETLSVEAEGSSLNQLISTGLTKPAFRRPDQVLSTEIDLFHEDNDAFEEYTAVISAGLERDVWTAWRGGLGVSLETADLTDAIGTDQSYLVGLPLHLEHFRINSAYILSL